VGVLLEDMPYLGGKGFLQHTLKESCYKITKNFKKEKLAI